MKTVVQLMSFESVYNENLQRTLQNTEAFCREFHLESMLIENERKKFENGRLRPSKRDVIGQIIYWIKFNSYLNCNRPYDKKNAIINIQFVDLKYVMLLPYFKKNFSRIVLSFWGSDLLRQKKWRLQIMRMLFNAAHWISLETDEMISIFQEKIGNKYNSKLRKANFGLSVIDSQDKLTEDAVGRFAKKNNISRDKTCIVIGYNRGEGHQHYEVVKSLVESEIRKDDYFLIIPWTYGLENHEYREKIENLLKDSFEYTFLERFMTQDEIACLRACTDILFQVQITDSLSATMLETLYAEKEVITGSWLPYQGLVNAGISMTFVDKVSDSGRALEEIVKMPTTKEKLKKNKETIYSRFSWEACIDKWISLYR